MITVIYLVEHTVIDIYSQQTEPDTRTARSKEPTDFQRCPVSGCYLCKKSVGEISTLLNISWSTVCDVKVKCKHEGPCVIKQRAGRHPMLSSRYRRVFVQSNCYLSIVTKTQELRIAFGLIPITMTVQREVRKPSFHGRANYP